MAMRDLPPRWRRLGVALMLGLAGMPFAFRAWGAVEQVLETPMAVDALTDRVKALEDQSELVNVRMELDSARSARILCISEVQVGIRPQLDLNTRCVR